MSNPNALIIEAKGLNTQPNELQLPQGSLAVAENVEITRDNVIQMSPGFENFSTNLPDFKPQQLFAVGGILYAHIDGGIWWYDTASSNWYRKKGNLGTAIYQPRKMLYTGGILYVSSSTALYALDPATGRRTVFAGRFGTTGSTDGVGDAARFASINGMVTDGTNIYLTDGGANNIIRKIVIATQTVSTIAGTAGVTGSTDATGAAASFSSPYGICMDATNLYIADTSNRIVRRIAPPLTAGAGVVTTIAGTAGSALHTDGTGAAARFRSPAGMCMIGTSIYMTDTPNSYTVRRIAPPLTAGAGVVTTIAGDPGVQGSANGTGTGATFQAPVDLTTDGTSLYVTDDSPGSTIRKVSAPLTAGAGIVTTPYGGGSGTVYDGIGTAARFQTPFSIAYDGINLYVSERTNDVIRKIYTETAYVTTIDGVRGQSAANSGLPVINGVVVGPT